MPGTIQTVGDVARREDCGTNISKKDIMAKIVSGEINQAPAPVIGETPRPDIIIGLGAKIRAKIRVNPSIQVWIRWCGGRPQLSEMVSGAVSHFKMVDHPPFFWQMRAERCSEHNFVSSREVTQLEGYR